MQVPVKVLEVICIYGYTLFVFIPVSFCLPFLAFSEIAQWVVIMAACGWSGFFLVSNLLVTVKDIAFKRGLLVSFITFFFFFYIIFPSFSFFFFFLSFLFGSLHFSSFRFF